MPEDRGGAARTQVLGGAGSHPGRAACQWRLGRSANARSPAPGRPRLHSHGYGRDLRGDLPALSGGDAEFALLLSDSVQRRGLGAELLRRLVRVGHDWGCARVVADILPDNFGMINVSRKVGFTIRHDYTEEVVKAELVLG